MYKVLSSHMYQFISYRGYFSENENFKFNVIKLKGDGNDGEPDARRKLEFEKRPQIGWN